MFKQVHEILIPFAVSGIKVMFEFIKLLNLTITEGMLNGITFYVKGFEANRATFFPSQNYHVLLYQFS